MSDFDYLQHSRYMEHLREHAKAQEDALHNREIEMIVEVGEQIISYCLDRISEAPEILEQEGGLNTIIRTFILSKNDWSYFTRNPSGVWFERTGCREAKAVSYEPISQTSIPDLVVNAEALRVELKSASLFTSKSKVPRDFFSKDLEHLHGDSDFNKFDYEGTTRANRRAEMCLLIGDMEVMKGSKRLTQLLGDDLVSDTARDSLRDWGVDGIRFAIRDCEFRSMTRAKHRRLCAIMAFPGKKSGERT